MNLLFLKEFVIGIRQITNILYMHIRKILVN